MQIPVVRISSALTICLVSALACARQPSSEAAKPGPTLDSLSVERGACYGTCEIYDFVVRRDGTATLTRKAVASPFPLPAGEAQQLLTAASNAGLSALPTKIRADSTLCPLDATDHSTIIVTAYAAGMTRRVEHYTGCYIHHDLRVAPALERLVILERRVDALVVSKPGG